MSKDNIALVRLTKQCFLQLYMNLAFLGYMDCKDFSF